MIIPMRAIGLTAFILEGVPDTEAAIAEARDRIRVLFAIAEAQRSE